MVDRMLRSVELGFLDVYFLGRVAPTDLLGREKEM